MYGYPGRWQRLPEPVQRVLRELAAKPASEHEGLDRRTLRLLDEHGLVNMRHKRLDVEPPFLLWIQETVS